MEKIKLNLSWLTFSKLTQDCLTFSNDPKKPFSINGFLNKVFFVMYERRKGVREKTAKRFTEIGFSGVSKKDIFTLADGVSVLTYLPNEHGPLDTIVSIRPGKGYEKLYEEIMCNELKSMSFSSYLRYLLDDYLKLNQAEREFLLFHDAFAEAEKAIESREIISFIVNGMRIKARPYLISSNFNESFIYIYGIKREPDNALFAVHLFKVADSLIETKESFDFTDEEKARMDDALRKNGIEFSMDEYTEAKVALDDAGFRMLTRVYYNRPIYEMIGGQEEGSHLVKLMGSWNQIGQYVYRLGEHAFLIEPEKLRWYLARKFKRAYNHYQRGKDIEVSSEKQDDCLS